ncbi:hypothetical protein M758_2G249100 [Ceratodon purpureus]|nr:hypothetical protein M758_2G249100 [Ceratodon purpureus]
MMVDVGVPSVTGVSSELVEASMVDVTIPLKVGDDSESVEKTKVDVVMASAAVDLSVTPEVDVGVPSAAAHVSESKAAEAAEADAANPPAAGNTAELAGVDEGNVDLAGENPASKLVDCVNHFCPTSEDTSDTGEAMDSKLEPELLKATAHAIEAAGNEGLSIPQLARTLGRAGHEMNEEALEMYIRALEAFDVVKQVNAYDHERIIAAAYSAPFFIHVKAKKARRSATGAGTSDKGNGESNGYSTMATLTSIATGSRTWTRNIQPNLQTDHSHQRDTLSPEQDNDSEVSHTVPMLPWLTGDGGVNTALLKALTRRVLGVVMQNPGIMEEHLVDQLRVLNPQTARQFLQLLEYDGHVKVRKFLRARPPAPPGLLGHLIKLKPAASMKPTFGSHYYANCTSGTLL